jgi:hypothetical protein
MHAGRDPVSTSEPIERFLRNYTTFTLLESFITPKSAITCHLIQTWRKREIVSWSDTSATCFSALIWLTATELGNLPNWPPGCIFVECRIKYGYRMKSFSSFRFDCDNYGSTGAMMVKCYNGDKSWRHLHITCTKCCKLTVTRRTMWKVYFCATHWKYICTYIQIKCTTLLYTHITAQYFSF